MAKSPTTKLQEKCDSFLTPIIKKKKPFCESCGQPTQVAHHWIEKSRSNFLRYDFDNLIALCNSCHVKIHNRFGSSISGAYDVADTIIKKRGKKWKKDMDILGKKLIKINKKYYEDKLEELKKLSPE